MIEGGGGEHQQVGVYNAPLLVDVEVCSSERSSSLLARRSVTLDGTSKAMMGPMSDMSGRATRDARRACLAIGREHRRVRRRHDHDIVGLKLARVPPKTEDGGRLDVVGWATGLDGD